MSIKEKIMTFEFGTKGETLERLSMLMCSSHFTKQYIVSVGDWNMLRDKTLHSIKEHFKDGLLAVRSSAISEDSHECSMAGVFSSFINIKPATLNIIDAVNNVIDSYDDQNPRNQVLVQTMINDVVVSGVVLTRDLDTGSPYYVINYDDITGRTDSVTGGVENKCILVHHLDSALIKSDRFRRLISIIQEVELATSTIELDIEFCITSGEKVKILQVRPLAAKSRWNPINQTTFDSSIAYMKNMAKDIMSIDHNLSGSTTVFGEMPDWNPAEIIGTSPKPLALSLYKYLITDSIWSISRAEMGYTYIGKLPLLIDFCGRPFIDVRKSLNSFLPENTNQKFSNTLINYQLNKLIQNQDLHDKVEFEIAITCRDFNYSKRIAELTSAGLNTGDLADFGHKLLRLTESCINTDLTDLFGQTKLLENSRALDSAIDPISRTKSLLSACIEYGTMPFSKLARHAFIAVSFLKSAINKGIFGENEFDEILRGIQTVATDITHSISNMNKGKLGVEPFMKKYGHLRPGTYDITSYRYDEKPELYFNKSITVTPHNEIFTFTEKHKQELEKLLHKEGFSVTADQLIKYIFDSVELREAAKFEFTHNLSDALTTLCTWGEQVGISRENISYLTIEQIFNITDIGKLKEIIVRSKEKYKITRSIRLPHLITSSDDIGIVRLPLGRPTFISNESITAPVKQIGINCTEKIDQYIILIESADPGFDWIFSYPICGLITKYGGANSHMAIRCAEFGLPAAIGCGERIFNTITTANTVELNCASHFVRKVN